MLSNRQGRVHPTIAVVSGSTCCTNGLRCLGNWPFDIREQNAGLEESSFGYGWMEGLSDFGHHDRYLDHDQKELVGRFVAPANKTGRFF